MLVSETAPKVQTVPAVAPTWRVIPWQGNDSIFTVIAPSGQSFSVQSREMIWGTLWTCTNSSYLQQPDDAPEFAQGDVSPIMAVILEATQARIIAELAKPEIEAKPARAEYCTAFPHRRDAYLKGQRIMFGAAHAAGLNINDRAGMLRAINILLRTDRKPYVITSRKQLSPNEFKYCALAFEAGAVGEGWQVIDLMDFEN